MLNPDKLFSVLSDPTRLRIMLLIQQEGEVCVCEIMHALQESQPKVSRHLALMRRLCCVSCRREGTWMHYRINPDLPVWTRKTIAGICTQLQGLQDFDADTRRLHTMNNRPQTHCA
jgi:ArsR family transcriptional regulator